MYLLHRFIFSQHMHWGSKRCSEIEESWHFWG